MSLHITEKGTLVSATTLTGAYQTAQLETSDHNQLSLLVDYDSVEASVVVDLKIEASNDGTKWYQLTTSSVSSGVDTRSLRYVRLTTSAGGASNQFQVSVPINARFTRVSYKENSVSANYGTVAIDYFMKSDV